MEIIKTTTVQYNRFELDVIEAQNQDGETRYLIQIVSPSALQTEINDGGHRTFESALEAAKTWADSGDWENSDD